MTKENILLTLEDKRLCNLKISLENRAAEPEHFCQLPDSQEKIQDIATGILRQLEETESRLKLLSQRLNYAKKQMDALKLQLHFDSRHTCYKVTASDNSYSAASVIADAIMCCAF